MTCSDVPAPTCGNPWQSCYFDASCATAGGIGCYAGGAATCRYCGGPYYPPCPIVDEGASREAAQVITLSSLAASAYRIFVGAPPRLCRGYGLPAPPAWPGAPDGRVDCIGNCFTGTGYCYATADSKCQQCSYYSSIPGQPTCSDLGAPQGGPLYGTAEWGQAYCPTLAEPPVQASSSGGYNRLLSGGASVELVQGDHSLGIEYLPTRLNTSTVGVDIDYAQMLCLDAAATSPEAVWGTALMTATSYEAAKLVVSACDAPEEEGSCTA